MTTTNQETRNIIRAEAQRRGCRYRITKDGEVHFYGQMPNANETGWWLFAQTPQDALETIEGPTY